MSSVNVTQITGNKSSRANLLRERKFQGANWPGSYWPIRSWERIGTGANRLWIRMLTQKLGNSSFCACDVKIGLQLKPKLLVNAHRSPKYFFDVKFAKSSITQLCIARWCWKMTGYSALMELVINAGYTTSATSALSNCNASLLQLPVAIIIIVVIIIIIIIITTKKHAFVVRSLYRHLPDVRLSRRVVTLPLCDCHCEWSRPRV